MADRDEGRDRGGDAASAAGLAQLPAWAMDFLRSLFDLEFRRLLTPRMLPTLFSLVPA
jgi:hypothetical protein